MGIPITGPVTYSPTQGRSDLAKAQPPSDKSRFSDLLKAITPEEASALADTFGPARPASRATTDPRGRHLDVRA